jgi:hypothetical protein
MNLYKFIVKHEPPDLVHQLALAMRKKRRVTGLSLNEGRNKIIYGVGNLHIGQQLERLGEREAYRRKIASSDVLPEIG